MKKSVQTTLTGEKIVTGVSLREIIWLFVDYLINRLNIQKILFLLSFLTFGIGDAITAAYMIEKMGVMREINPIARFFYLSNGVSGLISIKIWYALLILFATWIISIKSDAYWTVNGFLCALFIGGIMAMRANIMAMMGLSPPSPDSIIMTYLALALVFILMGDVMDKMHTPSGRKGGNVSLSG